jgi:hypothetical protein
MTEHIAALSWEGAGDRETLLAGGSAPAGVD